MESGERGDLLRLLRGANEALSLYAAGQLQGQSGTELVEVAWARLASSGSELADALLSLVLAASGSDHGTILARVLSEGSLGARLQAVARLAPGLGPGLDGILGPFLTDPSAELRGALLGALGRVTAPLGGPLRDGIRGALADPDSRVRANAAEALSARGDEADRLVLEPLLEDPVPRVRAAAARGLFEVRREAVQKAVEADLASGEPRELLAALHVLGAIPAFPGGTARLVAGLQDPSPQVRLMAARSLEGREAGLDPEELSRTYLADESQSCRRALGGLARRGPRRAFCQALVAALSPDQDPRVRSRAVQGLGDAGTEAEEALVLAWIEDPDPRVRAEAVESLGRIGGPATIPVLETALADPAPRVAANAALALWRRGGAEMLARLSRWLRGDDAGLARSAAFALGEIGSVEVVAPLLETAERLRDEGVEDEAGRSLLKQVMKALTRVRSGGTGDG